MRKIIYIFIDIPSFFSYYSPIQQGWKYMCTTKYTKKKRRKDLSQKIALEEFISPLGKQQANSRLTWPPSTSISFSFHVLDVCSIPPFHIYISQLRDQSLRLYIGRHPYIYIFIHRPYNTHIESTCFINV